MLSSEHSARPAERAVPSSEDPSLRLAEVKGKLKSNTFGLLMLAGLAVVCVGGVAAVLVFWQSVNSWVTLTKVLMCILVVGALAIGLVAILADRSSLVEGKEVIEAHMRIRGLTVGFTSGHESGDYFANLVKINVENLSAYYVMVKRHANRSFLTSIGVGIVGFALIIGGLAAAVIKGPSASGDVALVSSASGVITEFISAVFFFLYNKTVRQLKEYHDSLLMVQNVLLSFKLVGDTSDAAERAKMVSAMLAYLLARKEAAPPSPDDKPAPKTDN